jgi:hypothetical protein
VTLERLGDSTGFAGALVEVLLDAGWTVGEHEAFGGGVLMLAAKDGVELAAEGRTRAQTACRLLCRVAAFVCEQRFELAEWN